ncbi:MAG: indole-3-glycerol phosphate synthase TrpC [Actinomycetota bacterium]|nr:indole-3-glycerol phosphate synthase TrpC [Actinomycetota bacterium]
MSLLEDIVASTRARAERMKRAADLDALRRAAEDRPPARSLEESLLGEDVSIIAEIKRTSPLKGPLNRGLDAARIARAYADGGAAAVSVLTEPEFFEGSLDDLEAAASSGLPLLRKDFVLDPIQIVEGRAAGADAILLIVRTLGEDLYDLLEEVHWFGMDALVEVHDERDVDIALTARARLIGINNRDLETFEVDPERTPKLIARLPEDVIVVALSGVSTRGEVEALADAGAAAVLVGESLVTATDPAAKLRELRGVA